MDTLDRRLGVNVGTLIGHSAVRHYVMGDESQGREATAAEIEAMRGIVRDAMLAGALGLSVSKNKGHTDPQGVLVPAIWAAEAEIFALGDVLSELGTGIIQGGGGRAAELENRLMSRLSQATGRQVVYNNLGHNVRQPMSGKNSWPLSRRPLRRASGPIRCAARTLAARTFTMENAQVFRTPTWDPILRLSEADKLPGLQ